MKVVILAGGLGTRISEESVYKPKPMIEIGNMPILWHIMKEYSYYGFHDFVICAGYKQHMIKEWFADYFLHTSDITFDFTRGQNEMIVHNHHTEPWKVTVVDTGLNTMTGVDPGVVGSGKMQLSSVTTSKRGSPQLRKALFQVVSTYVKCKPENEAVYQFYAKKRDEGKPFFVCTTAAANKFLRIYYARVKECLNAAESATQVEEG
jgi:hypothetical protein